MKIFKTILRVILTICVVYFGVLVIMILPKHDYVRESNYLLWQIFCMVGLLRIDGKD